MRSLTHWKEVSRAPTSTTNMTGFLIIVRGLSLRNASITATRRIAISIKDLARGDVVSVIEGLKNLSGGHEQMLENRPQTESREKSERPNHYDRGYQQAAKQPAGHRKGAQGRRCDFLSSQIAGDRQYRDHHEEAAQQHGATEGG